MLLFLSVRTRTLLCCAACLLLVSEPAQARQAQRRSPFSRAPGPVLRSEEGSPIPAGEFTVSGTVVNAVSGAPLARARITLSDSREAHQPLRLITGDDGHFAFIRLPAGKFSLHGARRGFVPAGYEQHEQFSTAIVTGADLDTQSLQLKLMPLGFLSGRVVDESGEPLRRAHVSLFRSWTAAGFARVELVSNDVADDRGYYEFPAVPPGRYYVAAMASPWYALHPASTAGGQTAAPSSISSALDVAYPTTFYNGATDSDSAALVTVSGGDQQTLDMHLQPVPSLHLTYRLPPQNGGYGFPSFAKRVFGVPENINTENSCVNDICEISGVPAGRYTVSEWDGGSLRTSEMDLSKDGQEIDVSQSKLSAEVILHAKLPPDDMPPERIYLGLLNRDTRHMPVQNSLSATGDVKFLSVPPGAYNVVVGTPGKPYAVTRIAIGNNETNGHSLIVPSGGSVEATVSVYAGVINIEGVVKRGARAASGIMVALVPDNDPEQNLQLFRRDQSDLDGTFILRGVIPGNYTLIAVEDAWGFEWLNPGVLSRYLPHGQNVRITEHMRGSVLLPEPVQVLPR